METSANTAADRRQATPKTHNDIPRTLRQLGVCKEKMTRWARARLGWLTNCVALVRSKFEALATGDEPRRHGGAECDEFPCLCVSVVLLPFQVDERLLAMRAYAIRFSYVTSTGEHGFQATKRGRNGARYLEPRASAFQGEGAGLKA